MRRWLAALGLLLLAPMAWGACSNCLTSAASCDASSNSTQVQSCISSMPDQGTLTFAAGTYTFGVRLDARNGITAICETAPLTTGAATTNPCTFSAAPAFSWDSSSLHATNLIRISGFRFTNASGPSVTFAYNYSDGWIDKFRIDHNTFTGQSDSIKIGHGANPAGYQIFGVIDSNLFEGTTANYVMEILGDATGDWAPALAGTGNAIFIEDNTFDYTGETSASGMDLWRGGRMVVRFNTITNARTSTHGVCHNGPALVEVYNNDYTSTGGVTSRIVHHQGSGEILVWGNSFEDSGEEIALQHYRSFIGYPFSTDCNAKNYACDGNGASDGNRSPIGTYRGYPCWRQPGRDSAGTLRPIYVWNNWIRSDNSNATLAWEAPGSSYYTEHIVSGRDYYRATSTSAQSSATSPFNGSSSSNGGMGWGTLANRPTSCTATPEAADAGNGGVGYWATDGGSNWNTSNGSGNDGGLYRCSATDTWTLHYTPYTYPHPLRAVTGGPPAPTNFRVH